jgi:hypothetical protein
MPALLSQPVPRYPRLFRRSALQLCSLLKPRQDSSRLPSRDVLTYPVLLKPR